MGSCWLRLSFTTVCRFSIGFKSGESRGHLSLPQNLGRRSAHHYPLPLDFVLVHITYRHISSISTYEFCSSICTSCIKITRDIPPSSFLPATSSVLRVCSTADMSETFRIYVTYYSVCAAWCGTSHGAQ